MRKLVFLALTLLACKAMAGERLILVTEDYPPYNMLGQNGQVEGVSTEIVQGLMTRADIPYQITLLPWARAIALARVQANTCAFSTSRTPEREALYKWVGPLVFNDWTLFAKKSALHPMTLDSVKQARIGSYQGSAVAAFLQARGFTLDLARSDGANPRVLLAGHIDYWATGKLIGEYRLQQQGLADQVTPVLTFSRLEMYLACQKDIPDASIAKLNTILADMQKSAWIRQVYGKFGYMP